MTRMRSRRGGGEQGGGDGAVYLVGRRQRSLERRAQERRGEWDRAVEGEIDRERASYLAQVERERGAGRAGGLLGGGGVGDGGWQHTSRVGAGARGPGGLMQSGLSRGERGVGVGSRGGEGAGGGGGGAGGTGAGLSGTGNASKRARGVRPAFRV